MKIRSLGVFVIAFIVAALVILAWSAQSRGQDCGCDPGPYPEPSPPSKTIYLPVVSLGTFSLLGEPPLLPDPDKPVRPPTADKPVRPPPSAGDKPVRLVILPTDDATVDESKPTMNFGSSIYLRVDGIGDVDGQKMSYVRFDLGTELQGVERATLKLTASTTVRGVLAHRADPAWLEGIVTWETRPSTFDCGTFDDGETIELDVTGLISGTILSIGLSSPSEVEQSFYSSETEFGPTLTIVEGLSWPSQECAFLPVISR